MMQETPNGMIRNWSVRDIGITKNDSYRFGINREYIDRLTQLLIDEKFYIPEPGEQENLFTFKHL